MHFHFCFLSPYFFLIQRTSPSRPEASIERAILNRFAYVLSLDSILQVCKRPVHFQYPIIGPRR